MNPENENIFDTEGIRVYNNRWVFHYEDLLPVDYSPEEPLPLDIDSDSNSNYLEKQFCNIDEIIISQSLGVHELVDAIKESGVWDVKGFKQEDLDTLLIFNLDPKLMKLILLFSIGKKGQIQLLSYLNGDMIYESKF